MLEKSIEPYFEIKHDLEDSEYHSIKTHLSSSMLRDFMKSPLYFYTHHIQGVQRKESKAQTFGRAVHMALLEPDKFMGRYKVQPDFGDLRTKKAKESLENWLVDLSPGAQTITSDEFNTIEQMSNSFNRKQGLCDLLKDTKKEVTVFFKDITTDLKCKSRLDSVTDDLSTVFDLKTTQDASKEEFKKSIYKYGYDIQASFYLRSITNMETILVKRQFYFIAIEKEPPFEVAVYKLKTNHQQIFKIDHAIVYLNDCLTAGYFPGIQTDVFEEIEIEREL